MPAASERSRSVRRLPRQQTLALAEVDPAGRKYAVPDRGFGDGEPSLQ